MKKYIFICLATCATLLACKKNDFLDKTVDLTNLNEAEIFSDSTKTFQFLTGIYSDAKFSFNKRRWDNQGNLEMTTDDMEYRFYGGTQRIVILYSGAVSPGNFPIKDQWTTPYTNIRRVNLFLKNLPNTPLSAPLKKRMEGEARFLRTWYYENLIKSFGGVPLLADTVFSDINTNIDVPRNSYEDCVNYLVSELDACEKLLPAPDQYEERDYGRVTKGACLALKSRVLLYAASPLFNGGMATLQYRNQENLQERIKAAGYPTADNTRWQRAADAAKAVMNSGYYQLVLDNTKPGNGFYSMFLTRKNSEYIFFANQPPNIDIEQYYNPPSRSGGYYGYPTQNFVNCFPMKNGKSISDQGSGYNKDNPYVNRDPRFAYTIMYNGSKYSNKTAALEDVWTYDGAPQDGYNVMTVTGYYCRKMCDEKTSNANKVNTPRGLPLLRYGEIVLNYAEAINEAGNPSEAYTALKEIRERAGIDAGTDGMYGLKSGMIKEELREVIRNERRIELSFEDHRFFDVRRWMIGMTVLNGFNKAMKITKTGSTYKYNEIDVEAAGRLRNFRPEMYLLPIYREEITKSPKMVQNPGW
ncbi:RagB/SusD family nutrient uptake outer membrane protein [Pedobacter heparinus]|uniref:RagB/SusD family nutrient uptake outer membrane protein n=1 Tax=Pedobacter heparinus TaxID=984 RepID=UPI002930AD56|nr:RagB/SusD family nutrient uptake outer membrane protein [Pedobacter heparinus]